MNGTATLAAAFTLLLSSTAFAQISSPPAPEAAPPVELQEVTPEPAQDDAELPPMTEADDAGERSGDRRGERVREMRRGGRMGPPHWMHHGGGRHAEGRSGRGYGHPHRGGERSRGAEFMLSSGGDGPKIAIKCADRDTTLECANAIMPVLNRFLSGEGEAPTAP